MLHYDKINIRGVIPNGARIAITKPPVGDGRFSVKAYNGDGPGWGNRIDPQPYEYQYTFIVEVKYVSTGNRVGFTFQVLNGYHAGKFFANLYDDADALVNTPVVIYLRDFGSDLAIKKLYVGKLVLFDVDNYPYLFIPMEMKYYNYVKDGELAVLDPTYGPFALWSNHIEGLSQSDQDDILNPTGGCAQGNSWLTSSASGCFFTDMTELQYKYFYDYCDGNALCGNQCYGDCLDSQCLPASSNYPYQCGAIVPTPPRPGPTPPASTGTEETWIRKYWWIFVVVGILVLIIITVIVIASRNKTVSSPLPSGVKVDIVEIYC